MSERTIEYLRVVDIIPASRNPKRHAEEHIAASVDRFGYTEPIMLDERTGKLVAGHGRLEHLLTMQSGDWAEPPDGVTVDAEGEWCVPVVRGWSSADDAEAEAYLIASNRLTEAGGWDDRGLTDLLRELAESATDALAGTGFDEMMLANLVMLTRFADEIPNFDAAAEWAGIADYTPEGDTLKITVSFRTEEDRQAFLDEFGLRDKLVLGPGRGPKTYSAWWPVKTEVQHDGGLRYSQPG